MYDWWVEHKLSAEFWDGLRDLLREKDIELWSRQRLKRLKERSTKANEGLPASGSISVTTELKAPS
jgi:hypothetical protein